MSKRKPIEQWTVSALLTQGIGESAISGWWSRPAPGTPPHEVERQMKVSRSHHRAALKYLRELARRARKAETT